MSAEIYLQGQYQESELQDRDWDEYSKTQDPDEYKTLKIPRSRLNQDFENGISRPILEFCKLQACIQTTTDDLQ